MSWAVWWWIALSLAVAFGWSVRAMLTPAGTDADTAREAYDKGFAAGYEQSQHDTARNMAVTP